MNDALRKKFKAARALFPHTKNIVYLNTASQCPFATTVKKAIEDNVNLRLLSERDDSPDAFAAADELRRAYAKMIGAAKRQVGIGLNTSFGLNIAAFGYPFKKGDEVLIPDIEFPAVVYTWKAAAEARGLRLRYVKSRNRFFDLDELEKAISSRTRVLALSWVQFFNGFKVDLAAISTLCKQQGILLVVDGIQGMGVEPVNVRKLGIDVFTSGGQKWLLAPRGGGFFYLSDEIREKITPPFMSWLAVDWKMKFNDLFHFNRPYFDSARRFELGYDVVFNLLGMRAAVKIFEDLGIRNIQRHNRALIDRLAAYIRSNPYYTITCRMEPRHRSSIFSFTCPDVERLHAELLKRKIITANREGSIRTSVHLFNNEKDIDRVIGVLERFSRG